MGAEIETSLFTLRCCCSKR